MRINERFNVRVIFGSALNPARGTKCRDQGILPLYITGTFKEFNVLRVGTRPATFDEGNAKIIQFLCDADLVIARKRKAFRLCPIAESSIVDLDLLHKYSIFCRGTIYRAPT